MKVKNIIIILVIAIIVIAGSIFVYDYFTGDLGILNTKNTNNTPFDNAFISGEFVGTVEESNITKSSLNNWTASYKDKENNIEYNMSTFKGDDSRFYPEYLLLNGYSNPEFRTFNGVE